MCQLMLLSHSLRASSPGRSGVWWDKEGELATTSLEFKFHLQFPCDSLSSELSVCQSAQCGNERKTLKTRAKGNDVNTNNVISANQHFALTFLMKIFKFQRCSEWELGYRYPALLTSCLFALSGAQFGLPLIYCTISFWLLLLFFHYSDIIGVVWSDGN